MPSPVIRTSQGVFYRRKDGAWIKKKGRFVKVGKNKYRNRVHYSKHIVRVKGKKIGDAYRKGRKAKRKLVRRYPQEYD